MAKRKSNKVYSKRAVNYDFSNYNEESDYDYYDGLYDKLEEDEQEFKIYLKNKKGQEW